MSDSSPDTLADILRPERPTAIVDVGANPIDGTPPYKAMLEKGLCRVVGFEPQAEALAQLQQRCGPFETYLPHALGDGGEHMFQVCKAPGMSSLLVPDPEHLALFNLFPIWGEVKSQVSLQTKKLADVVEIAAMDFLKMDVQGSELDVLAHAGEKLAETVAIQTEVSFVSLYKGQPSFGEVDIALRKKGFIPHCFAEINVWPITPAIIDNNPQKGLRQLQEADLVYVRDFSRSSNMTGEQWKHLALIAHHCYGSIDLALRAVTVAAQLGAVAADSPQRYMTSLQSKRPN